MRKILSPKRIVFVFLVILTGVGFWYRFWNLSTNYSFWIDETSSAAFARAILARGVPILPTGYTANDYVLHFYLMAASFKIFGLTEFAARIPSVIFGALTIPLVYFLGKKYADWRVGLVAAFLTAFSILEITYSRQARAYQELQFFSVLSIFVLFILLQAYDKNKVKLKYFVFLFIAFGLSALTHKFALLFAIAVGAYFFTVRIDILKNFSNGFINPIFTRTW